jgi:hypothetical protein
VSVRRSALRRNLPRTRILASADTPALVLWEVASTWSSIRQALGGERWRPRANVRLEGEGLRLLQEEGDGDLIVKRLMLEPDRPWSKDEYWSGTFHVRLATPPNQGVPRPDAAFEVAIAGRLLPHDILKGLASHINERSRYGALVEGGVLEILGPTRAKAARGVDRLFSSDAFALTSSGRGYAAG